MVENVFEKKEWKTLVCETVVWLLADRVKNLIEKKWPGLSDSDMVTGGLKGKERPATKMYITFFYGKWSFEYFFI